MKKHPFFHTLVISSACVMDGCATSHGRPIDPDAAPLPDVMPAVDVGVDSMPVFDAGPILDVMVPDAREAEPDAGPMNLDAGEDANLPDAGPDVFPADANMDHRLCAPGWPPTKGVRVCQVIDEEGVAVLRCAYAFGDEVDWGHADTCNAAITAVDEIWPGEVEEDFEYISCSRVEDNVCRLVDEGDRQLLVCADATCELTPVLLDGDLEGFR